MKKSEIQVGGHYVAKVSGRLVTVRVDAIRPSSTIRAGKWADTFAYDVTNLSTNRKTTFRSAAKFRRAISFDAIQNAERTPDGKVKLIDVQVVEERIEKHQQAEAEYAYDMLCK